MDGMEDPSDFSPHELNFDDGQLLDCDFCNLQDGFSRHAEMDNFIEDLLRSTQACTHSHTCNPPGPDKEHTHTCYHTHTQLFVSAKDENTSSANNEGAESESGGSLLGGKKRPAQGREANREAVKKYREKKKAHVQHLEEQVQQLRVINHHLMHRLQKQAALEAEVLRLRTFLSGLSSSITSELKVTSTTHVQIPAAGASVKMDTATFPAPAHECTGDAGHAAPVPVPCGVTMPCLRAGPEIMPAACHVSSTPHQQHAMSATPGNTVNVVMGSVDEDRQKSSHLAMPADHFTACHMPLGAHGSGMETNHMAGYHSPPVGIWGGGNSSPDSHMSLDDAGSPLDRSGRSRKGTQSDFGKRQRGKRGGNTPQGRGRDSPHSVPPGLDSGMRLPGRQSSLSSLDVIASLGS